MMFGYIFSCIYSCIGQVTLFKEFKLKPLVMSLDWEQDFLASPFQILIRLKRLLLDGRQSRRL